MTILRTPEERFNGLKDFNFEPNYFEVCHGDDKLRMHYLDENPSSKDCLLYTSPSPRDKRQSRMPSSA